MERLGDLLAQWLEFEMALQFHKRGIALIGAEEHERIRDLVAQKLEAINAHLEARTEDRKKK